MADKLVAVYDPKSAERLSGFFVECAQMGLTMIAGDPSRFVNPDEHASGVIVGESELEGEGTWTAEHVRELYRLTHSTQNSVGTEWGRCPECGHEHYDGYGGVPCAVQDCSCERTYLPRVEE